MKLIMTLRRNAVDGVQSTQYWIACASIGVWWLQRFIFNCALHRICFDRPNEYATFRATTQHHFINRCTYVQNLAVHVACTLNENKQEIGSFSAPKTPHHILLCICVGWFFSLVYLTASIRLDDLIFIHNILCTCHTRIGVDIGMRENAQNENRSENNVALLHERVYVMMYSPVYRYI